MPQLFSRMDDVNWLTPSIADVLDQGTMALGGGGGSVREQMLTLQNELAALETPAKVINISAQPSHTIFVLQPDYVGRLGARRLVSAAELRRSVGQIAERHKEWRVGFMPALEESPEHCGILLRTGEHRPLSLRRLLVQSPFKNENSNLALTLGSTLSQRVIVRALDEIEHLLVVGEGAGVSHAISSALMTLVMFNTPAELKIALAGERTDPYGALVSTPHSMGIALKDHESLLRLVSGMTTELQRRLNVFYDEGVTLISAYNNRLRESHQSLLPRIVLAVDSLSDAGLQPITGGLAAHLRDLILNGAQVGIHLILSVAANDRLPPELMGLMQTELILRSAALDLGEQVPNFHPSMMRFIDAFVLDRRADSVTPVEICAVLPDEVKRIVSYWQQAEKNRSAEMLNAAQAETPPLPSPPVMPSSSAAMPMASGDAGDKLSQQAEALASYLGWVSLGALQDVLLISPLEAAALLAQLQDRGLVEKSGGRVHRLLRPQAPIE